MYVREFHAELVDPAEQRTTDLGFIACVLTDTDPTKDATLNFGDIFVEYVIELSNPRVGAANPKCCHISSFSQDFPGNAGVYHPMFHPDAYSKDPRSLMSEYSTLMLDMEHYDGDAYKVNTSGLEYSALTFKEPFSGTMTLISNTKGAHNVEATIMCNGVHMKDEESEFNNWTLQPDAVHPHRYAKVKPIRSIKNGINSAVHIVKVVAQAGETLALAIGTGSQLLDHYAEVILQEASPLILDAMELLVL
jgi:hypothetical protein